MIEKNQILQLEKKSASLEPSHQEREWAQASTNHVINRFLDHLSTKKTYAASGGDPLCEFETRIKGLPSGFDSLPDILQMLETFISENGILTAGPGHMGFIPGGGIYLGAIADHFASALNTFCADAYSSPVAVHIHEEVIRWLTKCIGYHDKSWGDITSGGSHATLTAFYVARQSCKIKAADYAKTCVYLSEHTHHCSEKALRVLFGDELILRKVSLKEHVIDVKNLRACIVQDQNQGLRPWMIVGTAGSTNLGLVDPLFELSQLAQEFSLWLHVDGAYGGFFKLCKETQDIFKGIEQANSVVLDPHKGMFLPYGCGAVLIKDGELLHRSVNETASYLQDCKEEAQKSPMNYSLELSRPFRSLRIWLALKIYGEDTFRHALSEKLLLTQFCYEKLNQVKHLKLLEKVDLSILGFRYEHPSHPESTDEDTRAILKSINEHGDVFLSSTMIDGYFVIRVAILSFRTHLERIEKLIQIIEMESRKRSEKYQK